MPGRAKPLSGAGAKTRSRRLDTPNLLPRLPDPERRRKARSRPLGEHYRKAELCRLARMPLRTVHCAGNRQIIGANGCADRRGDRARLARSAGPDRSRRVGKSETGSSYPGRPSRFRGSGCGSGDGWSSRAYEQVRTADNYRRCPPSRRPYDTDRRSRRRGAGRPDCRQARHLPGRHRHRQARRGHR